MHRNVSVHSDSHFLFVHASIKDLLLIMLLLVTRDWKFKLHNIRLQSFLFRFDLHILFRTNRQVGVLLDAQRGGSFELVELLL